MRIKLYLPIGLLALLIGGVGMASGQSSRPSQSPAAIPPRTLLTIIRHEDERRWDDQLQALIADPDAGIRRRAVLAAGRIGDDRAVPVLTDLLFNDRDDGVRELVAFALGEIEAPVTSRPSVRCGWMGSVSAIRAIALSRWRSPGART